MYDLNLTESYVPAQPDGTLLDLTVGELLREQAAALPDVVAVTAVAADGALGQSWTHAELLADAERLALSLTTRFEPGERVVVWAPNVGRWLLNGVCIRVGRSRAAFLGDDEPEPQVLARPVSQPDLVPGLEEIDLEQAAETREPFSADALDSDTRARVVVTNVGPGYAVFAVSTRAVDDAQNQMLITAAIALGVVLAALAAALWSVDRLGIRPIESVTKAAEDVAAGRSDHESNTRRWRLRPAGWVWPSTRCSIRAKPWRHGSGASLYRFMMRS